MRRGAKPGKAKVVAKPPVARKSLKSADSRVRDLEKRLAEALEQQAATSEILRVIASSPTDIRPVFDAVAETAVRLCESSDAEIFRRDGDRLLLVAHHGPIPSRSVAVPLVRGTFNGRTVLDGRTFHVADLQSETDEFPRGSELARQHGTRAQLSVPLMREGVAIGTISLRRTEARLFTERQVALLKTFADQAVIAIENVRLFNETKEALEQQTATSEILGVISQSPTDVQPVFDTIAARAKRLCDARECAVFRFDGELIHLVAQADTDAAWASALRSAFPRPPGRGSITARAIQTRSLVHIPDVLLDPEFELTEAARASSVRSTLSVPMIREGEVIGAITVDRGESKPFLDKQIGLVKIFADQAVIAIENVRLFKELQTSNRDLTTALDQQTATSDILRVISRSQTDVQPVFDAIVASAVRLLGANTGVVTRLAGDQIELAALTSTDPTGDAALRATYPQSLRSEWMHAQAIRSRAPLNIVDAHSDPRWPEATHAYARARGWRSGAIVPLLRHDEAVGTIGVSRREAGGFTDDEIALLQTFADQAVIAIENARLFNELEGRNRDLTEGLERETATGEILRVISSSPTDIQPVLDTVVKSAARLCDAYDAQIFQREGDQLLFVAHHGPMPSGPVGEYTVPLVRGTINGRSVLEGLPVHVADMQAERDEFPEGSELARRYGHRTVLSLPLMREGVAIGTISVRRAEIRPFTERQIALLQTFADQAVIAIENVRLFTELQASNRGLIAALDKQTATSDILRVISRSQTNVQPVFDAILGSAVRLLRGYSGVMTRMAGDQIELAALTSIDDAGDAATRAAFPQSHESDGPHAQAMRDRTSINITDAQTDSRVSEAVRANARARGNRSWVIVPLLRHDEAVGTIAVTRREPGEFTDDEIALLKTFADQAVIAIENARLLTELQARTQELSRSVGELQALGEVGQAISSTLDLETVLTTIVSRAVQLSGLDGGVVFEYDEGTEEFVQRAATDPGGALAEARRTTRIRKGEGVLGRTAITLEPIQVPDITLPAAYEGRLRETLVESGIRAILAVPMVREGRLIGCLGVTRNHPGDFPAETIELLRTFATQSALAIQNARLFQEIEHKSRQLEVASQHKSEFLANMSHELRTPLNAIIGFSEVLTERMFGELNEKQDEYLRDIYASGQHLLSLINDILDLSKIEAGRMELEATDFDLPSAIDNALILVRERATRRGITLGHSVDERPGSIRGDERKVKQVLLNLLSNALKFTPEGGRIDVSARVHDEVAEVSVTDTGVGIAPEDQETVFEEFRQVGAADKKVEGTGLGLALSRKFIELHGGRIWVKSQVGHGSTFTFTLPVRREE